MDLLRDGEPPRVSKQCHDYTIGWICALPIERAAAEAMIDERHEPIDTDPADNNTYILGSIYRHNVVVACLPSVYGMNNAASVAGDLRRSFPAVKATLIVGIGGGAPTMRSDIRLGDVVVGTSIVQSDLGKITGHGQFDHTAVPRTPPRFLDTAVSSLRASHELRLIQMHFILQAMGRRFSAFTKPSAADHLFQSSYPHQGGGMTCDGCDLTKALPRKKRESDEPVVHYGRIASGNQVIRNGQERDRLAQELGGALCFEMEAAGLMEDLPCLAIRGICDYADSHKHKEWQRYAAAAAAAYAKELLGAVRPSPKRKKEDSRDENTANRALQEKKARRREQLLRSLHFEAMGSRMANIEPGLKETCGWFLDHPDFRNWIGVPGSDFSGSPRERHDRLHLWLRGRAGAGKSTMVKFLYKEIKQRFRHQTETVLVVSFFFHGRGTLIERSVTGLYRSLLSQILESYKDLQSVLDNTDIVPNDQKDCPPLRSLKELLGEAISRLGKRCIICFIDALDEADEQQVREMLRFFIDTNNALAAGSEFRILFSSRPYPEIGLRWGKLLILEDQPGHRQDIDRYVRARLSVTGILLSRLTERILQKAAGVFMWVVLVVEILNREHDHGAGPKSLERKLDVVPAELSNLFVDLLSRDNLETSRLQSAIFWMLYNDQPFTSTEFCHALWSWELSQLGSQPPTPYETSPESEGRLVTSSTKGLAELTRSGTVQFIHESVRDFLLKEQGLRRVWPEIGFAWESFGYHRLRECCAAYLQVVAQEANASMRPGELLNPKAPSGLYRKYPLWQHADNNIFRYSERAAETMPAAEQDFLRHVLASSYFSYRALAPYSDKLGTLVSHFSENGHARLLELVLQLYPGIDNFGGKFKRALLVAAVHGHIFCVIVLLEHSSAVLSAGQCQPSRDRWNFPSFRHQDKSILGHVIKNSPPDHPDLKHAMMLLFSQGASLEARDSLGRTEIAQLVESPGEHLWAMHLLMSLGADPDARDNKGLTPLHVASKGKRSDVCAMLLKGGASVNSIDPNGRTALLLNAAKSWSLDVCKVLLDAGAAVDVADTEGRTALHEAARHWSDAICQALLRAGASIEAVDGKRRTALHDTARSDRRKSCEVLLQAGAHVNAVDHLGRTALHYAAWHGSVGVCEALLQAQICIDFTDRRGHTALHSARTSEVCDILLRHGARPDAQDDCGRTALHEAAGRGLVRVCRCLLRGGTSAGVIDHRGRSALHDAATCHTSPGVCEALLKAGAPADALDGSGRTALHEAVKSGNSEACEVLINHGVKINIRDNMGRTPLQEAMISSSELVGLILSNTTMRNVSTPR